MKSESGKARSRKLNEWEECMKNPTKRLWRYTAECLVFVLILSLSNSVAAYPQSSFFQQATSTDPATPQTDNTAGAVPQSASQTGQELQQGRDTKSTETGQRVAAQQQEGSSQPVGVAAAPYEKSTAITASRPAGAAIAPAKQRRTRSILIKTGLLVGACVAVGTVVALSKGSPSQPH